MTNKRLGKKGSVFDTLIAIVVIFGAGVAILIVLTVWNKISNSGLTQTLPFGGSVITNFNSYTLWTYDFMLIMLFLGFFGGSIVLAAFARHHPVLAFMNILVLIVLCIISVPLSNNYQTVFNSGELSVVAGNLTGFGLIMKFLPILTIGFSIFLLLAMFAFKSEVNAI